MVTNGGHRLIVRSESATRRGLRATCRRRHSSDLSRRASLASTGAVATALSRQVAGGTAGTSSSTPRRCAQRAVDCVRLVAAVTQATCRAEPRSQAREPLPRLFRDKSRGGRLEQVPALHGAVRNAPWTACDLSPPSLKRLVAQSLARKHGSRCHGSLRDKSRRPRLEQVPALHGAPRNAPWSACDLSPPSLKSRQAGIAQSPLASREPSPRLFA